MDFSVFFFVSKVVVSKRFGLFVSAYDYNNFEKSFEKFCTEHSEKLTTKKRNMKKEKFTKIVKNTLIITIHNQQIERTKVFSRS